MSLAGLAFMTALAASSTVTGIRIETAGALPVVYVDVQGELDDAVPARLGREVIVTFRGAQPDPALLLPPAAGLIESLRVDPSSDGARLRVRLKDELSPLVEVRPSLVVLRFEAAPLGESLPASAGAPDRPASVAELYAKIMPPPLPIGAEAGGQVVPVDEVGPRAERDEGWRFGFLRFRPALVLSYIDAESAFLDSAEPVRERYFQIEPHLGLGLGVEGDLSLLGARLRLNYEPRFRASTSLETLRRPTHIAMASLTVPLGATARAIAMHEYANGTLETTQVDPGREYFFGFGRFIRNTSTGRLELNGGGRIVGAAGFVHERLEIDDRAAFFDHESNRINVDAGYLLGPELSATARVEHERVPTPEKHPEAESNISTVSVGLEGEVAPLVRVQARVGHRIHDAPRAGDGGQRFSGTYFEGSVRKEFTPTSFARLAGTRTTYLSAFETNGYYRSTAVTLDTGMEVPFYFVLHGALSWQRNAYDVVSAEIGEPRRDRLWSWSAGLGRSVTRWGYARVDYRRDYRDSNLAAFDTDGHAFVVSLGIGYHGQQVVRR